MIMINLFRGDSDPSESSKFFIPVKTSWSAVEIRSILRIEKRDLSVGQLRGERFYDFALKTKTNYDICTKTVLQEKL